MNTEAFPPHLWITGQSYGTHVYDLGHEKNKLFFKWLRERYPRLEYRTSKRRCDVKLPKGFQVNQFYLATKLDELLYEWSRKLPGKIYVYKIEVSNMEWPSPPADNYHSSNFDFMASFYFCIEPDTMPQSLKDTRSCV